MNPKNLHHAYILEGNKSTNLAELFAFLEKELKIAIQANPDLRHTVHDTFTIDDARNLIDMQATKALDSNSKKIFIIELRSMTVEAQNALLKVFEEPTPDTHFFILTSSTEIFLPTLKSRVLILNQQSKEGEKFSQVQKKQAQDFIALNISDRLKEVGKIIEEKDKTKAVELIDSLLSHVHSQKEVKNNQDKDFILKELLQCRTFMHDRSPSLKLLLEHICLIL